MVIKSSKLCPECGSLMDRSSYFNKWMCSNYKCNNTEILKTRNTIEELIEIVDKLLYIVDCNDYYTLNELKDKMDDIKTELDEGE